MAILRDLLDHNLRAVFCGTAAGTASAQRQAYYAGPGNKFWDTLFEIGLTPRRFEPEEYPSVVKLGLGFTDLAKGAFALWRRAPILVSSALVRVSADFKFR